MLTTSTPPRVGALVLALLLVLLAAPAGAYEVMTTGGKELHWSPVPMKFNIDSKPAPGLSASATQQAIRAAYASWSNVSCSSFKSQDIGLVNATAGNLKDLVNTHVWLASWPSSYDPQALAITITHYNTSTAMISDADTEYNPSYSWSTTGASKSIDLQSVSTHEIGHQLGLTHSDVEDATMYYAISPGDTSPRTLHSDDLAGLCHLYPAGKPLPGECTTTADCSAGEVCQNKVCTKQLKGYGEVCEAGEDCVSGICVESGSQGVCTQQCDTKVCPNNDKCYAVAGSSSVGNVCKPGSATTTGTKSFGESCTAGSDCKSGVCVSVSGKGSFCSVKCDLQKQDCPTDYECKSSSSAAVCVPKTTTPPPPPPKKGLGETCSGASDCQSALCAKVGTASVCISLCDLDKPACPAGFTCTPISGKTQGGCIKQAAKRALGDPCTAADQCSGGLCVDDGEGGSLCSRSCDPQVGCPDGYDCSTDEAGESSCRPAGLGLHGGGCSYGTAALGASAVLSLVALPLLGLSGLLRRRRRAGHQA